MALSQKVILLILFLCVGCVSTETKINIRKKSCINIYDKTYQGHYKLGKPYIVKNVWYFPKHESHYDRTGVASWYGDAFHCKKTANGAVFNKWELSAAHKTLPLPSIAEVVNLSNGKTIRVVVNDRGPFVNNRIIDLSEKAAMMLGTKDKGLAKVRVKFLAHETNQLLVRLGLERNIETNNKIYQNEIKNLAKDFHPERSDGKDASVFSELLSLNLKFFVDDTDSKDIANDIINKLSHIGYAWFEQSRNKNNNNIYKIYLSVAIEEKHESSIVEEKLLELGFDKVRIISNH